MKKLLLSLSLVVVCGCHKAPQAAPVLLSVEGYVHAQPYRAFEVLDSLASAGRVATKADSALYTLLYEEALEEEGLYTASDSAISACEDYYERQGDRSRHAWAVYLHSRCRIMSQEMQGMEMLKQAERLATEQGDNNLLYKVHATLGQSNGEWGCSGLSIEHWKAALSLARATGGQERYAASLMQLGRAYGRMGDSANYYRCIQRSIPLVKAKEMRAQALSALAEYYYQRGDTTKSMDYAARVAKTGLVYRAARLLGDMEWNKGNFDGAATYYYQAIECDEFETRVHALKRLVEYFNKNGNNRRMVFYFERLVSQYEWRQSIDPVQLTLAQNEFDRQWRQDNTRRIIGRAAIGVGAVLLMFFAIINWQKRRNRRLQRELEQLNSRYNADLQRYHTLDRELAELRSRGNAEHSLLEAKEREVSELQRRIAEYQEDVASPKGWNDDSQLLNSDLVFRLHALAARGERVDSSYWQQLNDLFDEYLPHFLSTVNARSRLSQREQTVCELIRLRFIPSEIAVLLLSTPQVVSNLRAHLLLKIFDEKGGAKRFDERIREI